MNKGYVLYSSCIAYSVEIYSCMLLFAVEGVSFFLILSQQLLLLRLENQNIFLKCDMTAKSLVKTVLTGTFC